MAVGTLGCLELRLGHSTTHDPFESIDWQTTVLALLGAIQVDYNCDK